MAKAYFSHDCDARMNNKMLKLRAKHGPAGYGVYWMLVERLRAEEGFCSEKNYTMLSFDFHVDEELVRSVVEDFELFDISEDGATFSCHGLEERMEIMEIRSEAGKKGAAARWGETSKSDGKTRSQLLSAARKRGTHTKEDWYRMQRYFGGCVICGRSGADVRLVKDHIIPIYQGGGDLISNIQPLCQSCNLKKGADKHDYRIDWCKKNNMEMPEEWLAKNAETPDKLCEMPANKKKTNKTQAYKEGLSDFPSLNSSPDGEERMEISEEEKEKILFEFVFEKNLASPGRELELFLDYNNSDGRSWSTMTQARKEKAIRSWKQEPKQEPRFKPDFLAMWRTIFETMVDLHAPRELRMAMLADNVTVGIGGRCVVITCDEAVAHCLEQEEMIERVRPAIKTFLESVKRGYIQYKFV